MTNIVRQVSLSALSYNSGQPCAQSIGFADTALASKDIYGQEKVKLKTSEASRYFECGNCGRKIAGSRFAQHINKCLERDRRRCLNTAHRNGG